MFQDPYDLLYIVIQSYGCMQPIVLGKLIPAGASEAFSFLKNDFLKFTYIGALPECVSVWACLIP